VGKPKCVHGNVICDLCVVPSDAAKRFADGINALLTFNKPWEIVSKWVAVRLQDGSVDSSLYDTRAEAISHQSESAHHFYIPVANFASGISAKMAELMLLAQRHAYDAGIRITDDRQPDMFMGTERQDAYQDLLKSALQRHLAGLS
jgi:hypothetical protein